MNNPITFDWNHARAFLATAEAGSLSAAGRALNLSQPTVGRQVAALGAELGVVLFERIGKGLTLTPAGVELAEQIGAMGAAAQQVALTATGQSQTIAGAITLTASEVYSTYLLPPVIRRLRDTHPGITVDIVASNDVRDLRRREADIALRNTEPKEPDLIGKRIGTDTAHLYATPEFLSRHGTPRTAAQLSQLNFVGFDQVDLLVQGLNQHGLSLSHASFPVTSANHLVQWAMVCAGVGVGVMPTAIGDADPRVVRALPSFDPIEIPMWLIAHRELRSSRRVRLVFDMLAGALGGDRGAV